MSRAVARASLVHMLPAHLEKIGLRAEPIFREAGLTLEDLESSALVHRAQIHCVLSLAARAAGAAEIALLLGSEADSTKLGPTGLAFVTGDTLEQCLLRHIRMMPRLQSDVVLSLSVVGPCAVLTHRLLGDGASAWRLYEGAAAFHVQQMRTIAGAEWSPRRVSFPHACHGRRNAYQDFFGCEVAFGVGDGSLIHLSVDDLTRVRPESAARAGLDMQSDLTPIGRFCPAQIEDFAYDPHRLLKAISCMIEASMGHGALTLSAASLRLGLPLRTIQRRLKALDCTFEELVDDARRQRALAGLQDSSRPITDLAMSLGYSDVAHFNRAFHRWTGCSPSDFRNGRSRACESGP